jgi:hypothetical protein
MFGLIINAPQQTTPAHSILWGHFYRSSTCESQCNFLGNLFNNSITSEILRISNKKQATTLILAKIFLKLIELFYELNPGVYLRAR